MDISMKYFLAVAKEMNISHAAKSLYTSQQTVSYHIKQLELEYGTKLFNRTPYLSLTPAGEKMVWTLQQIESLENNLKSELAANSSNYPDKVRLMMPEARFRILAGKIIDRFYQIHPSIMLELQGNLTSVSENKLLNGEADMFIGINPTRNPQFDIELLHHEHTYLIGRKSLFAMSIPDFDLREQEFLSDGISYDEISSVPIIIPDTAGVLGKQLDNHFKLHQITPNTFLRSNNAELHVELCANTNTFGILPEMFLYLVKNSPSAIDDEIKYFQLKEFPFIEDVSLVRFNNQPHSPVTDSLAAIVRDVVREIYDEIHDSN